MRTHTHTHVHTHAYTHAHNTYKSTPHANTPLSLNAVAALGGGPPPGRHAQQVH